MRRPLQIIMAVSAILVTVAVCVSCAAIVGACLSVHATQSRQRESLEKIEAEGVEALRRMPLSGGRGR